MSWQRMAIRSVPPFGRPVWAAAGATSCSARHLLDEGIGRPGRHAEQGGVPQELAAVDRSLGELALERRDEHVLLVVTHH